MRLIGTVVQILGDCSIGGFCVSLQQCLYSLTSLCCAEYLAVLFIGLPLGVRIIKEQEHQKPPSLWLSSRKCLLFGVLVMLIFLKVKNI